MRVADQAAGTVEPLISDEKEVGNESIVPSAKRSARTKAAAGTNIPNTVKHISQRNVEKPTRNVQGKLTTRT